MRLPGQIATVGISLLTLLDWSIRKRKTAFSSELKIRLRSISTCTLIKEDEMLETTKQAAMNIEIDIKPGFPILPKDWKLKAIEVMLK